MRWLRQQGWGSRGATTIEYALIIVFLALVVSVAVLALGTAVKGNFNDMVTELGGTPAP
jgi:Flp pilus assembly pilin Flp